MKKHVVFGLALWMAANMPASANMEMTQLKNEYMRGCLANGGVRDICSCMFDDSKATIPEAEFVTTIRAINAGLRASEQTTRKIARAGQYCSKRLAKNPVAQPTPVFPAEETGAGNLLPPPPPPPSAGAGNNIPVPAAPANALPMPPAPPVAAAPMPPEAPMGTNYFSDSSASIDAAEAPKKAAKPKKKKAAKQAAPKERYFGQYDSLLFSSIVTNNLPALRAVANQVPDFEVKDQEGNTPLVVATIYGKELPLKFLLEHAANPNGKNTAGQTALHVASFTQRPDIVDTLLSYGADPNLVYGDDFTPVKLAIMQQDDVTLGLLLKYKAKPDQLLEDKNTAMHLAVGGNNMRVIQQLATYKANLNAVNKFGYTPLMLAAFNGNMEAVRYLIAYGAKTEKKDTLGRTAAQLAYGAGYPDIANMIAFNPVK